MSDTIYAGLLFAALVGLPVSLCVAFARKSIWSKVLSLVLTLTIFFGIGCLLAQENNHDIENFNNGICIKCNGDYRMSGATRTRMGSKTFYYTCQDCGWTIETSHMMNKNYDS